VRLYQVEHKIVLLCVVDAPQRSTQRRTLAPANLNVVITRSTVVHVQIAMIIKELPIGFTRTFTRAIRQRILKVAHIALVSPRSAVLAVVGEYLTTGEEEAGVPEVVVLAQICVNAACWVFCAVVFAHFKRLNIADDFHEVVLQDVAFTLNTTCAICWPGDTFFTWRGRVGRLREHCTGEGVEGSIGRQPGHGNTGWLPRADLLTLLGTQNIDDDVEDARDVPGDIALQAGGEGVRRELSLCQLEDEKEKKRHFDAG